MIVKSFCENRNELFADEFYDCLVTVCPECGELTEMSETLTGLHCSNPKCPDKVAQRLVAIATKLGIKDLGDARALDFVRKFGVDNPLLIFSYDPKEDGTLTDRTNIEISERIANAFKERNKFTLPEYIKIANLPFIQESATCIFDGFDDLGEAYQAIESGGIKYIQERLSIKDKSDSISIRALKVYDSLMLYKSDLFDALDGVEIIKLYSNKDMVAIKAVCSTSVGVGFKTKADFYATCNNLYGNIHIDFGNAVTKKTQYLIWSGADGSPAEVTNKVKKARAYKEQGVDIKIVTALQFLEVLENINKG